MGLRVLAIQNYEGTVLGQIATALDEAGAETELLRPHAGDRLPDAPDGYDALVVLGGAQNARADAEYPYLPKLAGLIRDFGDSDRAVLGVCLGCQLLARAYDAENIIGGAPEFGWRSVELTGDGREDPVLGRLPERFHSFQWHDDTFVLPRGATRLAGNMDAHNQAFRIGRAAYGMQFHFEADRSLVGSWSRDHAAIIAGRDPGWAERMPAEADTIGAAADRAGLQIARAWTAVI